MATLQPLDPIRGPLVLSIADGTSFESVAFQQTLYASATVYVASDQALTLTYRHGPSADMVQFIPSGYNVLAVTPASFHIKTEGRWGQIELANSSGAPATVTLDLHLGHKADDDASVSVSGDVEVVQSTAGDLLCTATVEPGSAPLDVSAAAVEVVQTTASALLCTATVEPGSAPLDVSAAAVEVVQTTAGDLLCTATVEPGSAPLDVSAATVTVQATGLDTRVLVSSIDSVSVVASDTHDAVAGNALQVVGGVYRSTPASVGDGDAATLMIGEDGAAVCRTRCKTATLADGASNTQELPLSCSGDYVVHASTPYVYNGTTWDRLRGDTDGLVVQQGTPANLQATVTQAGTVTTTATERQLLNYVNDSLSTTGVVIATGPHGVRAFHAINDTQTMSHISIYDKATAPTESDTPIWSTWNRSSMTGAMTWPHDYLYVANGLAVRCAASISHGSTVNPSANTVACSISYFAV